MSYFLHVISLDGCPYSKSAVDLLNRNKINFNLTTVTQQNKEKYKTDVMQTFPQIYLNKEGNKGSLLLGGFSDLQYSFDLFYKKKLNDESILSFKKKYRWNRKSILRYIELINKINNNK